MNDTELLDWVEKERVSIEYTQGRYQVSWFNSIGDMETTLGGSLRNALLEAYYRWNNS